MRLRSILPAFCFASVAAVAACENVLEPADTGEFVATWAGDRLTGPASANVDGAVLTLHGDDLVNGMDGRGFIVRVEGFDGPGVYALGADDAEVRYVTGGDGIGDVYRTTRTGAGSVTVSATGNGRVAGSVRFDAEPRPGYASPVGDLARFEGTFNTALD
jgi:hypothetical protein